MLLNLQVWLNIASLEEWDQLSDVHRSCGTLQRRRRTWLCSGLYRCSLAAWSCPFSHPYDIIWHWSSCHLSPPYLLPLPSSCPPFLCSWPGLEHQKDCLSPNLFCFQIHTEAPQQPAPVFSFLSVFSPTITSLILYSWLSLFFPHLISSSCLLVSKCLSFSSSVHHQFQFTSGP